MNRILSNVSLIGTFSIATQSGNLLFYLNSSGNIGIRNATASYALHILGTASTTGFRMTNGSATNSILRSNGTGDASWSTLASLNIATGSGTQFYYPYWTSSTSLSSTSSIYTDGNNISIGSTTTTPARINVSSATGNAGFQITSTTYSSWQYFRNDVATYSVGTIYSANFPYFSIAGPVTSLATPQSPGRLAIGSNFILIASSPTGSTSNIQATDIRNGEIAWSNFPVGSSAKAYTSTILMGGVVSGGSVTELKCDGITSSNSRLTIPNAYGVAFDIFIHGLAVGGPQLDDSHVSRINGHVRNVSGTLTLANSVGGGNFEITTYVNELGTLLVDVQADSVNDALLLRVQNRNSTDVVRWFAKVELTTLQRG